MKNELVDIARQRYLGPLSIREIEVPFLSKEEIEALGRRHIPYTEAISMVCGEMQCARSSFFRYYRHLLKPFSLAGGGRRQRFCWEDDVLRAIAQAKIKRKKT